MGRAGALTRAALVAALALGMAAELGAAERFSRGVLWRVTKQGAAPSHVFGTLHLADPRVLEIAPPVLRALDGSRRFAMEAPRGTGHEWQLHEAVQLDGGRTLESLVGAETYERARKALAARSLPEELIRRIKPWAVLANIVVTPEDYESVTLDDRLLALARARRMEVLVLESEEEQIAVFDGIPLQTQVAMLRHALEHRDWLASMIEPTLQAWLRRDLAGVRAVHERVATRFPEMTRHYRLFHRHLVEHRNVVMAHRLTLPLRAGRVFVAVGAAHLYGESGLLRLIERQGYRVARVY